jgi:hypothetical protein
MKDPISEEFDAQLANEEAKKLKGQIASMAARYDLDSPRLFGFVMDLDYAKVKVSTCDPWKRNCGGAPRGGLIILRLDPNAIGQEERAQCDRLIIARIADRAPTPVDAQTQQTLFEVHRLQAPLDPITKRRLQYSAMEAKILGTYYDSENAIEFGGDVQTFFSGFCYLAYMPTAEDLGLLINAFVNPERAIRIGRLRYTETPAPYPSPEIPILIDPLDLIGRVQSAQRSALFGKTRFGKSNTTKVIAQAIFASDLPVSQLFIDPSGEYTYVNAQDGGTSLFALNRDKSFRYALKQAELSKEEKDLGLEAPAALAINFYKYPAIGHQLLRALWPTRHGKPPGYMEPILAWEPPNQEPNRAENYSDFNHYWRTMGMYFAFLYKAGFTPPADLPLVPVDFPGAVKNELVDLNGIIPDRTGGGEPTIANHQPIRVLPELWRMIYNLWIEERSQKKAKKDQLFPNRTEGGPYFDDVEQRFLECLGKPGLTAHNFITPFAPYHRADGSSVFQEIVNKLLGGTSVFVDVSQTNEVVVQNITRELCRELVQTQKKLFAEDLTKQHLVQAYFEEAHKLFVVEEKDPNSVYVTLAREGGKFNIAMTYATQNPSGISTDLTTQTDNFFICHLDDDREIKELTHKYMFRDVVHDVERIQTRGFVKMVTRSHRFALSVQIDRFSAGWVNQLLGN